MKQLTRIIAVVICTVLLTACSGKAADSEQPSNPQSSPAGQNSSAGSAVPEELSPLALAKEGNPDTVAWLRIPGTDIDNPVMQTANNEDYLRRNEKGEYDIWGCYFADYYSVLTDRNGLKQNTVIYGHSESAENPEGKRFTQLFKYLDLDFVKENPAIYLTVGEEALTFEVFAVFFTDTDFYYIDPTPSDQGFDAFSKAIAEKNEFIFDSSLDEKDKLLTLSACAYRYDTEKTGNQRLVVMGKLLPKGAAVQTVTITPNPNPQRP